MKTAVVLTTINIPKVLSEYIKNFRKYGHRDAGFIIVGDKKTPAAAGKYALSLQKKGYPVVYLGLDEQIRWLRPFPKLQELLPYNSIQRRNIGYLYAAESGADMIISIDDDNCVLPDEDFLGYHKIVNSVKEIRAVQSSSGWFNVCSVLRTRPRHEFYHRGYPLDKRWITQQVKFKNQKKRVVVNAGLWTGDPDVDTITRLEEPFTVEGINKRYARLALAEGTWHPFNSQNTAFSSEVLPCFFLVVLGRIEEHLVINNFRYDDIWLSYFAKKIIDHMGDQIVFGRPLVCQRRNPHDYLKDVHDELLPMRMTPKLIDMISSARLTGSTYAVSYAELIEHLEAGGSKYMRLLPIEKKCLQKITHGMRVWLKASAEILSAN